MKTKYRKRPYAVYEFMDGIEVKYKVEKRRWYGWEELDTSLREKAADIFLKYLEEFDAEQEADK